MTIKLLGYELQLIRDFVPVEVYDPSYDGEASFGTNKIIHFNAATRYPYRSLLHEIYHHYEQIVGIPDEEALTHEARADLFAACTENLILSNGDDVFVALRSFSE